MDAHVKKPKVALIVQGLTGGGGVPTVARWLKDGLERWTNYEVDIFDLATSSRDPFSRRLTVPKSWARRSLSARSPSGDDAQSWGANAVELEFMRYLPRRELTARLRAYHVIQVVAGGAALALVARDVHRPKVLQVATQVSWERETSLNRGRGLKTRARRVMTVVTTGLERRALGAVDKVMVENQQMLEHLQGLGCTNVSLAAPGVDTERYTPSVNGWNGAGYVLSVCRFGDPRKGLDRVVEAYAIASQKRPSIPKLLLAGRGHVPEDLVRLVKSHKLTDRVEFATNVADTELASLYQQASVYVQGSYEEGLGLSVLEAMASGLPIVCTDTAGTRETVVQYLTGYLVSQMPPDRVPNSLSSGLLTALGGEGGDWGARGRARCVEHFSSRVNILRFADAYDGLLSAEQPRAE